MGNSNMYKALSVRIDKIFTKDLSDKISHHSIIEVPLKARGGGVLDISLDGEVRRGPSYPDPVKDKYRWFSYSV